MTAKTPCADNPDQWYTERDGRRHDDEPLLTEQQVSDIMEQVKADHPDESIREGTLLEFFEVAVDEATAEVARKRIVERRQARDACFTCPVRLPCLDIALARREQYGIWGGYYPEMRRAIERELDRREEAKASREL